LPVFDTPKPAVAGAMVYTTVVLVALLGATVAESWRFDAVPATAVDVLGDKETDSGLITLLELV
jgi:hypothetical protein